MLKISANLKKHLRDEVPMPSPSQFGKYQMLSDDNRQCCLVGWCRVAVGRTPSGMASYRSISAAWELARLISGDGDPVVWNDTPARSSKTVAARWRKTFKALGYKVENKPWRAKR